MNSSFSRFCRVLTIERQGQGVGHRSAPSPSPNPHLDHSTAQVCCCCLVCRQSWACLSRGAYGTISYVLCAFQYSLLRQRLGLISLVIFHLPLYLEMYDYSLNCLYCFFQWDGFDKCFILNLYFPGLWLCLHSSWVTLTRNRINSILYFQLL